MWRPPVEACFDLLRCVAVAATLLPVWAGAAGMQCRFAASGLALNFGTVDPSSTTDVVRTALPTTLDADQAGDCVGVSFVIDADLGLNFSGTRRMRSPAGHYLPYTFLNVPSPAQAGPGNGAYVRFTITGQLRADDYRRAPAGSYSDSVILTISP